MLFSLAITKVKRHIMFFFFFQAEDGIRDSSVTGVQTCALPISNKEIATIVEWVDAGAPKGNPADMPPPVKFDDDKWKIGTPDLVISLPEDLIVPGKAPDMWKNIVLDPGLTEDRYLQAVEVKPTKCRRVL